MTAINLDEARSLLSKRLIDVMGKMFFAALSRAEDDITAPDDEDERESWVYQHICAEWANGVPSVIETVDGLARRFPINTAAMVRELEQPWRDAAEWAMGEEARQLTLEANDLDYSLSEDWAFNKIADSIENTVETMTDLSVTRPRR